MKSLESLSNKEYIELLIGNEDYNIDEIECLELMTDEDLVELYQTIITDECLEIIL